MSNALQTIDRDRLLRLRAMCGQSEGENNKLFIPSILFNYTKGKRRLETSPENHFLVEDENGGFKSIGSKIEGTIVLITKQIKQWDNKEKVFSARSNEFASWDKPVKIFTGIGDNKTVQEFSNYREAKESHPNNRLTYSLYIFLEQEQVVRRFQFGASGYQTKVWWEYENLFKDGIIFQAKTIIEAPKSATLESGIIVWPYQFTVGASNQDNFEKYIKINQDTVSAIALVVGSYQQKTPAPKASVQPQQVNLNDIPFDDGKGELPWEIQ